MDSVTSLVKPIFFTGKVMGFFPFTISSEENSRKVNLLEVFQVVFNVSVWCVVFYYRFLTGLTVQKSASSLAQIGVSFGALMGFFVLIGSCIGNYFNRLKLFQILENLKRFDRKIVQFDVSINHRQHFQFIIGSFLSVASTFVACVAVTVSVFLVYEIKVESTEPVSFLCILLMCITLSFYSMVFCLLIMAIYVRFKWINEILIKNFKTEIDEDVMSKYDDTQKASLLSSLASLHDLLCTTVALANSSFGIFIAAFIGTVLVSVIFSFFDLYAALVATRTTNDEIGYCILINLWDIFLFAFVFAVVCVSSWSKREGKATSFLLHKALHYQDNYTIEKRIRCFIQQLRHASPAFSCGLYTFDWTVLYSFFGSLATYLVILIQFDTTPKT